MSNYSFLSEVMRFNPRTRKGCDVWKPKEYTPEAVSIHAPVKDATLLLVPMILNLSVSIHAPVKDATLFNYFFRFHTDMFQSTHP